MPPIEMKTNNYPNAENMDNENVGNLNDEYTSNYNDEELKKQKEDAAKTLIDIFGEDQPATSVHQTPGQPKQDAFNILDMLSDPVAPTSTPAPPTFNNLDSLFSVNTNTSSIPNSINASQPNVNSNKANSSKPVSNELDIMDLFGGNSSNSTVGANVANTSNNADLLDDLFGSGSSKPANTSTKNDILSLFGSSQSQPQPVNNLNGLDAFFQPPVANSSALVSETSSTLVVYEKNDIKIELEPTANGNHSTSEQHFIQMKAHNLSINNNVKEFLFSAAAPKTMQLQLSQPNTNVILPLDTISQTLAISNPKRVKNCFCLSSF